MKQKVRDTLFLIAFCLLGYSLYQLNAIRDTYNSINKETKELHNQVVQEADDPLLRQIDFESLKKINEDVVGWIYIPDTRIDEPVLKGESNDTYLRTSIHHQPLTAGTIFMDCYNHADFLDDVTIIYGHHMHNGSRFHDLQYYLKQKDYVLSHSLIYLYLPDGSIHSYQVKAAMIIKWDDTLYSNVITDYDVFQDKVREKASYYQALDENQTPILLLSTCAAHNSDQRFVVMAQETRP